MVMTEQLVRQQTSLKETAARIVKECLQVRPNEQVTIFTMDHTQDYATALALEVERAEGVSTTVFQANDFYWSFINELPETQFARRQKGILSLLDQTDAIINLGGPKDPSNFATDKKRTAKFIEGIQQMQDKIIERKIRSINLLVGLVTEERARAYGFDFEKWTGTVNNSLNVDHAEISRVAQRLANKIEKGRDARITTPSGTDLRFKLKGRAVHAHDGILDRSDLSKGTLFETLPAGTIEYAPDENSAEGVVLYDQPGALAGKLVRGLRFEFRNGHVVKYTAEQNLDTFRGLYENAEGDKDRFADNVIGLNPNAEYIGFFTDRIVRGAISVGIGANAGIGGDNKNVFGYQGTMRSPTLEVDGQKLVQDGKILA